MVKSGLYDKRLNDNMFFVFHHFSPFNCCLSVVLYLDRGDYPENLQVVFCPNK